MADRPRRPGDPVDPIRACVAVAIAIVAPFVLVAAVGELWDRTRPTTTAAHLSTQTRPPNHQGPQP